MNRSDTLLDLLIANHRLTQLAAQTTGSAVPSATWRALSTLDADGPMRVGELAAANRVTQPGMSRLVTGMLADGYVERTTDPDDSRASRIAATDRGRTALAAWRRQLSEVLEPRFEGLDDADWTVLASAARILSGRTAEVTA